MVVHFGLHVHSKHLIKINNHNTPKNNSVLSHKIELDKRQVGLNNITALRAGDGLKRKIPKMPSINGNKVSLRIKTYYDYSSLQRRTLLNIEWLC